MPTIAYEALRIHVNSGEVKGVWNGSDHSFDRGAGIGIARGSGDLNDPVITIAVGVAEAGNFCI